MEKRSDKKPKYVQMLAAWLKVSRSGEDFISICVGEDIDIVIDGVKYEKGDWIQIWKNKRKFSEKHPDFLLLKKVGGNFDDKYTKRVMSDSETEQFVDEIEDILK